MQICEVNNSTLDRLSNEQCKSILGDDVCIIYYISHIIHVWYIYLDMVDFYPRCRQICHTWMVWVYIYILGLNFIQYKKLQLCHYVTRHRCRDASLAPENTAAPDPWWGQPPIAWEGLMLFAPNRLKRVLLQALLKIESWKVFGERSWGFFVKSAW